LAAFTLIELMVVVTMIGIMTALVAPSFQRTVEVSRADQAIATLRTIWAAQRYYRLDKLQFADEIQSLETAALLDPTIRAATEPYSFAIVPNSATTTTFRATATRTGVGSDSWPGSFEIDQDGRITGSIQGPTTILPPREVP
jgi:type IV pilus assembly protein PilE